MGFEDFQVVLSPRRGSELSVNRTLKISSIVEDLNKKWNIVSDSKYQQTNAQKDIPLLYKTDKGVFEILFFYTERDEMCSLRVAYCNPQAVFVPFLEVVTWLMDTLHLQCEIMRDSPLYSNPKNSAALTTEEVQSVLLPILNYHRILWQTDFGITELPLRPDEAIRRFVLP